MSEKLNSATVRSRVRSGEYILCDKSNVRNSQVWTSFKSVCDRKNVYVGFAQCIKCGSVFVCKPGYGTSNLTRHIETCRANSSLSESKTNANEQSTSFRAGNQEDVLIFFVLLTYFVYFVHICLFLYYCSLFYYVAKHKARQINK